MLFSLAIEIVLNDVQIIWIDSRIFGDGIGTSAEVASTSDNSIDGADVAFDGECHERFDKSALLGDATFATIFTNDDRFQELRRKVGSEVGDAFLAPLRIPAPTGFELAALRWSLISDRIVIARHPAPR